MKERLSLVNITQSKLDAYVFSLTFPHLIVRIVILRTNKSIHYIMLMKKSEQKNQFVN
jgi:hypothetical protein